MAVLSELRYPTTRVAKLFSILFALVLFALVSVGSISAVLLYQVLRPARSPANVNLNIMMGHPYTLTFNVPGSGSREGWFFPGLRGAPTVIVSHGYTSQRAEVLTLVTALQDHEFNVFLFDYLGHGSTPGVTTLGYAETRELRAALDLLGTRDDVDPKHFGLWGVDLGAYASLEAAVGDPRVTALVVDSAYSDPRRMVQVQLGSSGLTVLPYVGKFCDFGFRMVNYQYRHEPPVTPMLTRLKGVPKLFIQSDDKPELAKETMDLFMHSPEPRETTRQRVSYADMSADDRHNYENQIVSFFLQNIPPTGSRPH
jgi:pimeloyl-ACP methyl ester carboxylesterase